MSIPTTNGGAAFPSGESYVLTDLSGAKEKCSKGPLHTGMTLRDYFAAAALPAIIADHFRADADGSSCLDVSEIPDCAAKASYMVADAMIAARKEKT